MPERYDAAEVKRRLAFLDLMAHQNIAMRRSGANWVAPCPFHQERSASFTVHASSPDHGHCYGCGWNGDIFSFWQARHGGVFADAIAALASLASVAPEVLERKRIEASQATQLTRVAKTRPEKPVLPRLRALRPEEIEALASLRQLSLEGIEAAAADKRVGACEWPQFLDRNQAWTKTRDTGSCWVVTDKTRLVSQFRRLDGAQFVRQDGHQIKAWTKGSPTWPLGAAEIGARPGVLLVEGGADMLAAYHFLWSFGRLAHVAVCSMLGGSCGICDEALPFFRRKRVRIIMDEDTPKPVPNHPELPPIFPGREAAARWTAALTEAGAAVETFSLAGLVRKDGQRVKDLNDLALVDEAAWLDDELIQAFHDFDF